MPILCALYCIGLACIHVAPAQASKVHRSHSFNTVEWSSLQRLVTTAPVSRWVLDGESTNTKDWACVRFNESTNGKLSPNIYQIQFTSINVGALPRSVQNQMALALYQYGIKTWGVPFHAWRADWSVCNL